MSITQKSLFKKPTNNHYVFQSSATKQKSLDNLPKTAQGLDQHKIQAEAMLIIRTNIIQSIKSSQNNWDKNFMESLENEIYLKAGKNDPVSLARNCLIKRINFF